MRYRIKLINTETGETQITMWSFSNRKSATEWAERWREQGKQFDCQVLDTKNGFKVVG